jgi:hypothetical protein
LEHRKPPGPPRHPPDPRWSAQRLIRFGADTGDFFEVRTVGNLVAVELIRRLP